MTNIPREDSDEEDDNVGNNSTSNQRVVNNSISDSNCSQRSHSPSKSTVSTCNSVSGTPCSSSIMARKSEEAGQEEPSPSTSSPCSSLSLFEGHSASKHSFSQRFTPPSSPAPSYYYSYSSGSIARNDNSSSSNNTAQKLTTSSLAGPEATKDPNWQSDRSTVRERNSCLLNNDLMSDITFVVGPKGQRIPAHKFVLSTGSSVFFAMFHGGLAEEKDQIEVPDVEPSAFLSLLRFLYTDDISLDDDNVLSTLYISKKYLVNTLSRACVSYLETSLNELNACLLLSQSRLFEEANLTERCWEVIDAQAELALSSEGFVDVDEKTLRFILVRDTLNAKELSIFSALLRWASSECLRQEQEDTPENQRKVIGDLIFLVRFPCMTLDEFADGPAQSKVLTLNEVTDLFLWFTASTKPKVPFPTKLRTGLKVHTCHRFQSSAYRSNQWRYRGRCDSIQFSVDKRIFIVGFGLYGSSNGASDYSVKMELKKTGQSNIMAENHTVFFSDGSSNTFHVYFKNPIHIEPETTYTASVVLEGTELSFFGQDGLSEVPAKGKVNFQFQCSSDSTNGTGVQGGQIPEILFYAPTHD